MVFANDKLERFEPDLNNYLNDSPSLGCGTSSVGSVRYSDNIAIHPPKMSKTKGSGRCNKGGKK